MKQRNPMVQRIFLKGTLKATAPLAISSGLDEVTDKDLVVDSDGKPYLPGTSLAGCLRAWLRDDCKRPDAATLLFGGGDRFGKQSPLWVYDARLENGTVARVEARDGVRLEEINKVAANGSKYNYQTVAPGAHFTLRLGLVIRESDPCAELNRAFRSLVRHLQQGGLKVGAKTRRGLGRVLLLEDARLLSYGGEGNQPMDKLLDFDWNNDSAWAAAKPLSEPTGLIESQRSLCRIEVDFDVESTLLIRQYMAENAEWDEDTVHLQRNGSESVVPGSSWGGFLRHTMLRVARHLGKETEGRRLCMDLFQYTEDWKPAACASFVSFDESVVQGARLLPMTRNRIDRITSGVDETALFSARVCVGGKVKLIIEIEKAFPDADAARDLILLALEDVQHGLHALGGETSVGRGLLHVEALTVDGKALPSDYGYPHLSAFFADSASTEAVHEQTR